MEVKQLYNLIWVIGTWNLGALAFGRFIVNMALTLDALEGSPKQLTKLREGGHALINGNYLNFLEKNQTIANYIFLCLDFHYLCSMIEENSQKDMILAHY